jgi:hypothetical protein
MRRIFLGTINMVRKLPPHIELWKDRHGKIRVYFRKGKGPRVALPAAIGSEEFLAAYVAALDGALSVKTEKRSPDAPGTIGALCVSYFKSPPSAIPQKPDTALVSRRSAWPMPIGHFPA